MLTLGHHNFYEFPRVYDKERVDSAPDNATGQGGNEDNYAGRKWRKNVKNVPCGEEEQTLD